MGFDRDAHISSRNTRARALYNRDVRSRRCSAFRFGVAVATIVMAMPFDELIDPGPLERDSVGMEVNPRASENRKSKYSRGRKVIQSTERGNSWGSVPFGSVAGSGSGGRFTSTESSGCVTALVSRSHYTRHTQRSSIAIAPTTSTAAARSRRRSKRLIPQLLDATGKVTSEVMN